MSTATLKLLALSALTALTFAAAAQTPAGQAPQPTEPQSITPSSAAGARAAVAARRAAVRPADGTFSAFSYDAVGATPTLKMRASRQGVAAAEPARAAPSEEVGALLATGAATPRR
jgi:hypothetical protein